MTSWHDGPSRWPPMPSPARSGSGSAAWARTRARWRARWRSSATRSPSARPPRWPRCRSRPRPRRRTDLAAVEVLLAREPLQYVHPLVRHAIRADIPASERASRHLDAARLLYADGESAERVAAHLLHGRAEGSDWVVGRLQAAAREAQARGAAQSACRYLQRALEEPPSESLRPGVLAELGAAEAALGSASAAEHLAAAAAGHTRSARASATDARAGPGAVWAGTCMSGPQPRMKRAWPSCPWLPDEAEVTELHDAAADRLRGHRVAVDRAAGERQTTLGRAAAPSRARPSLAGAADAAGPGGAAIRVRR